MLPPRLQRRDGACTSLLNTYCNKFTFLQVLVVLQAVLHAPLLLPGQDPARHGEAVGGPLKRLHTAMHASEHHIC